VKQPAIDVDAFSPNSNYILLRKCVNDHVRAKDGSVLVELTDKSLANTNWMEVVAVGPKCKLFTQETVGHLVHAPNWRHDLVNYGATFGDGYWICREESMTGQAVLQPFILIE
jgi:hypothetical protein